MRWTTYYYHLRWREALQTQEKDFFFHIPIVHTYQLRFEEMNVCVLAVSPTKDSMNI